MAENWDLGPWESLNYCLVLGFPRSEQSNPKYRRDIPWSASLLDFWVLHKSIAPIMKSIINQFGQHNQDMGAMSVTEIAQPRGMSFEQPCFLTSSPSFFLFKLAPPRLLFHLFMGKPKTSQRELSFRTRFDWSRTPICKSRLFDATLNSEFTQPCALSSVHTKQDFSCFCQ